VGAGGRSAGALGALSEIAIILIGSGVILSRTPYSNATQHTPADDRSRDSGGLPPSTLFEVSAEPLMSDHLVAQLHMITPPSLPVASK
jgi:hypothetical protein